MSPRASSPYEIRPTFRAPLAFVYRWCTDFSSKDGEIDRGRWRRKIVERTRNRVVLEDLTDTPDGWEWYRTVISLRPPDGWHAELRGNVPDWILDYRLSSRSDGRTRLTIRWRIRRRRGLVHPTVPPRSGVERSMRSLWENFRRALERDYRKARGKRPR